MAQASAEKFKHTGPAEKERMALMPQKERLASTPELPLPKGKGTKPSIRVPDHERGESQGISNFEFLWLYLALKVFKQNIFKIFPIKS